MNTDTTATRRQPTFPLTEIRFVNLSELSRNTGYPLRTIQRWNTTGVPRNSADRLAIKLGIHPANIWTTWYQQP